MWKFNSYSAAHFFVSLENLRSDNMFLIIPTQLQILKPIVLLPGNIAGKVALNLITFSAGFFFFPLPKMSQSTWLQSCVKDCVGQIHGRTACTWGTSEVCLCLVLGVRTPWRIVEVLQAGVPENRDCLQKVLKVHCICGKGNVCE